MNTIILPVINKILISCKKFTNLNALDNVVRHANYPYEDFLKFTYEQRPVYKSRHILAIIYFFWKNFFFGKCLRVPALLKMSLMSQVLKLNSARK